MQVPATSGNNTKNAESPHKHWVFEVSKSLVTTFWQMHWAGGLHRPYKGLIQPRLKAHERFANRKFITGCPPSGGGSLSAFGYRLTRKRVFEFLETHLVARDVLLKQVAYIFLYRLFVTPHCIYIVPPAPEVPVTILVLQIGMLRQMFCFDSSF